MALPRPALFLLLLTTACGGSQTSLPSATPTPTPGRSAVLSSSPTPLSDDPLSPRPAIESAAPLGQPVCDPAAVSITDADAVITDDVEAVYVLRTTGRPCQLEGFPRVTLLDESGRALPVTTTRSGATPGAVTLSAGTSLSFTLTTGRTGDCLQAASLRVVLPGTTTGISAPTGLSICGAAEIGPVQRLEDDEDEGAGG